MLALILYAVPLLHGAAHYHDILEQAQDMMQLEDVPPNVTAHAVACVAILCWPISMLLDCLPDGK